MEPSAVVQADDLPEQRPEFDSGLQELLLPRPDFLPLPAAAQATSRALQALPPAVACLRCSFANAESLPIRY